MDAMHNCICSMPEVVLGGWDGKANVIIHVDLACQAMRCGGEGAYIIALQYPAQTYYPAVFPWEFPCIDG